MSTLSLLLTPRIPSLSRIIETSRQIIQKWATPTNLALIGGSVIATITGSVALLSIMIAVRGYIASRSLGRQIETARTEYRNTGSLSKMRVAAIGLSTCWLVGAILSLPETGFAAEIPVLTSPVNISDQIISTLPAKASVILPSISEISADILADHPGQQYITLEQMVRRVEGLRTGVPLDNTASIANISMHEALYDEESPIRHILEARGHAVSELGLEKVARGLSREEIEVIVGEYLESTNVPSQVETPATVTPVPNAKTLEYVLPVDQAPSQSLAPLTLLLPSESFPAHITPWFSTAQILTTIGLIGGASAIGYAIGKYQKDANIKPASTKPASISILPKSTWKAEETQNLSPIANPRVSANWGSTKVTTVIKEAPPSAPLETISPLLPTLSPLVSTEETPEVLPYSLTLLQKRLRDHAENIFSEVFGWTPYSEKNLVDAEKSIIVHSGSTLGGSYQSFTQYTATGVEFTFLWFDNDAARHHISKKFTNLDHLLTQEGGVPILEQELRSLYMSMLDSREALKQEDMQSITSVAIPKRLLSQMYHHADQREVQNTEILGYWISSMYLVQDGELPVLAMNNPWLDEQVVTSVDCRLQDTFIAAKYNFDIPGLLMREYFPEKEAEVLLRARAKGLGTEQKIKFSGAMTVENWHKHPAGLLHPSSGDISEAVQDISAQYPGRRSHLYTILVEQTDRSMNPETSVIKLDRTEYGGARSYEFRSYIMEYPERGAQPKVRPLRVHIHG